MKIRSRLLPAAFLFSLLIAFVVDPGIGRFSLFLIPIIMNLAKDKKAHVPAKEDPLPEVKNI